MDRATVPRRVTVVLGEGDWSLLQAVLKIIAVGRGTDSYPIRDLNHDRLS